jgi:heptosyltransferase II
MKIVVRGTNWIGDAVMTIPALRELRRLFPDASITLHTRSWAEGIFRDADFIDEILVFENERSNFGALLEQASTLRSKHFDLAVIFPNSFRSALAMKLARIPRRFGYSKEARRFLLTDAVESPVWKDHRHEVHYYLNIVSRIEKAYFNTTTASEAIPSTSLDVSAERDKAAREFLRESGCDLTRPVIALGPGSTNSLAKRWPAERFAKLSDVLNSRYGANVIMLGSQGEAAVARAVSEFSRSSLIDLTGKTDLESVTAILSVADLFVSNDMGLTHIAGAVGTPTVVIFGPTNPITTRPFAANASVVREDVECSPCMLRECPIDHRCMTRITVDDVIESIIETSAKFTSLEKTTV